MSTLLVSSKGQIVLPAALRRRLALGAGSKLEVLDEADGLRLRVVRSVPKIDVARMAGMVTAPKRGAPRRLDDFDAASLRGEDALKQVMRSLDTNVLARFFIDDPEDVLASRQRPAAISALSGRAYVSVTVVLEFEWGMRGFYTLTPRGIVKVLRALTGLEHVTVEDRVSVLAAIDALEKGLDFADALHLARSSRATVFATFDRRLARRAGSLALHVMGE